MPSQKDSFAQEQQVYFLLSDFNTRLKDFEERNRIIRERVLLLGKNLISEKEQTDSEIINLKKQTNTLQKDVDKMKKLVESIVNEINKFVKKDEVLVIERMLKDFQPLEFMREKDVEALIDKKIKASNIKTTKSK